MFCAFLGGFYRFRGWRLADDEENSAISVPRRLPIRAPLTGAIAELVRFTALDDPPPALAPFVIADAAVNTASAAAAAIKVFAMTSPDRTRRKCEDFAPGWTMLSNRGRHKT